jgi:hypothetical protein
MISSTMTADDDDGEGRCESEPIAWESAAGNSPA